MPAEQAALKVSGTRDRSGRTAFVVCCRHDHGKLLQHLHDFRGQSPQNSQHVAQFQLHERPSKHIAHDESRALCLDYQIEATLQYVQLSHETAVHTGAVPGPDLGSAAA